MNEAIHVLLVEDDPNDVLITRRYLARSRRSLFHVRSIERIAHLPDALAEATPDVILIDLTLPDSRGLDTLSAAMLAAPDIPIIVSTGEEDEAIGLEAVKRGAQDYLVKGSVDAHGLARAIRYAIERKRLLQAIEHAALHDPLTGLANRELFVDRLRTAIERAHRSGRGFCVAFFDLDEFKPVNDRHGHLVGDALLREVGHRLSAASRGADTVARLGGDEFACIFEDATDPAAALVATERVRSQIAGSYEVVGPDGPVRLRIGASAGVSLFPQHGEDVDRLIATADVAMYAVKESGGDQARIFARD